jgi:hypothetical protein
MIDWEVVLDIPLSAKPIITRYGRLGNTLRQLIFFTFLCALGVLFVGITNCPAVIVFAQMHNMTMPISDSNSSTPHKVTAFSAIGQISSLVITVPEHGFNITNAFKVILTGDWNLSVMKGKITNFAVDFLASPMDGTKPHMHQITNFKSANKKPIELTSSGSSLINGTADIKINGQVVWKAAQISLAILNGSTFMIDPNDKETDNHFGAQPVYGIVTRIINKS